MAMRTSSSFPSIKAGGGVNMPHACNGHVLAQGSLARWGDCLNNMDYQQLEAINQVQRTSRIDPLYVS